MMQPAPIEPFDAKRLLIGEAPGMFLLEVAVRAIIVYVILLVAARAMGKRVAGQMSVLELTIIVTLGAAIGVPLETPERGMIPAVIVLAIAVAYQRGIGLATFKSHRAGAVLEGKPETLVKDGVIDRAALKSAGISRHRLFAMLRDQQLVSLSQVKRAYLEAGGQLSIYTDDRPSPGLCLLPLNDRTAYEAQFRADDNYACRACGNVGPTDDESCHVCAHRDWAPAVRIAAIRELRIGALIDAGARRAERASAPWLALPTSLSQIANQTRSRANRDGAAIARANHRGGYSWHWIFSKRRASRSTARSSPGARSPALPTASSTRMRSPASA